MVVLILLIVVLLIVVIIVTIRLFLFELLFKNDSDLEQRAS